MARRRFSSSLITGFILVLNSLLWPSFTNTFTLFFRNVLKDSDQNHETICLFKNYNINKIYMHGSYHVYISIVLLKADLIIVILLVF